MASKISIILLIVCFYSCNTNRKDKKMEIADAVRVYKLPYFNSSEFSPEWNTATHKIPNFSFKNQNGELITNDNYRGKIYVADFFFTSCPGICPKLTKNMKNLQESYHDDDNIMLLSHTVMPWKDTVELLKTYEIENGVDSKKWNLVTGEKDALYNIARNGYFADEDFKKTQDESEFIHTENFILVDTKGYIRGVYNGTIKLDIQRLKRHIEILKNEI